MQLTSYYVTWVVRGDPGKYEVQGNIWRLNLFEQAAETAARKTAAFD